MAKNCRITALVPMKGKSVRVTGKNLRTFGNRPLCQHILATLQECMDIDSIVVNTDSDEIAELASVFSKVTIHERPEHLWGHDVPMNSIIAWDLDNDDTEADHFLQTHATNPLLSAKTISLAIERYLESLDQHDSLFSVTPLQSRFYTIRLEPLNHNPQELVKTQDLEPILEENSCLYIFSPLSFNNAGSKRIGVKPQIYEMNKLESLDIDTEEEFAIAEAIWRKMNG